MIGINTLARPYAKAAFAVAQETKETEQWGSSLATLGAIISAPEMMNVLRNPKLSHEHAVELLAGCVPHLSEGMKNLLRTLAYNRRLTLVPAIAELFAQYKAEAEMSMNVEMVSAFPVNEGQRQRFIDLLSKKLQRKIEIECKTDESLIGGAIFRAGDQVIDGSVRGRLSALADKLI